MASFVNKPNITYLELIEHNLKTEASIDSILKTSLMFCGVFM